LILSSEEGVSLESKFERNEPVVGDELEFDIHLVTVEERKLSELPEVVADRLPEVAVPENVQAKVTVATPRRSTTIYRPPRLREETEEPHSKPTPKQIIPKQQNNPRRVEPTAVASQRPPNLANPISKQQNNPKRVEPTAVASQRPPNPVNPTKKRDGIHASPLGLQF
jgi:hypothetical protein